jgi:hypothetical protein
MQLGDNLDGARVRQVPEGPTVTVESGQGMSDELIEQAGVQRTSDREITHTHLKMLTRCVHSPHHCATARGAYSPLRYDAKKPDGPIGRPAITLGR